jgi:hypothetical protein
MPGFWETDDTQDLKNQHSGMVIIYVEGASDKKFMTRFFPDTIGIIQFHDVGGCPEVKKRLKIERPDNDNVFGIVDRDTLMREMAWEQLFDTDNDHFARTASNEDGLHVLTRWEIENYLFNIDAIQSLHSNWGNHETKWPDLLSEVVRAVEAEVYITAAWCTAHHFGTRQTGAPSACVDATELERLTRKWIEECLPDGAMASYEDYLGKLRAFDPGPDVGIETRLEALLRIVDGKRLLERLERRLLGIKRSPGLQLADNVGGLTSRTDDLFRLIQCLQQT